MWDEYLEELERAKVFGIYYKIINLLYDLKEKSGIKNIIESLPTLRWQYDANEDDGWIEVECEDIFTAPNIKEAKRIVSEYECGDSGVFTVYNMNKEVVFTEEDLWI